MKDEKTLTLEELKEKYVALGEEILQREKAEAEEREARLTAEKEKRRQEVADAETQYRKLLTAYIKDYGSYQRIYEADSTKNQDRDIPYLWHWFY